jgi:formiminotetrahydrofolate cyclodeaminase
VAQSDRPYLELSLQEWLDALAGPGPAPGGGSALAYATATAASVLVLAARASRGEWQGAAGAFAQAESLRERLAPLAQRDAELYAAAHERRRTAAELPPERRDEELGAAFARAAEPPLALARLAADVAELAAEIAAAGAPRVQADALAAAALAAAAAYGAAVLVEVNLTAGAGDPRVAETQQLASTAAEALDRIRPGV